MDQDSISWCSDLLWARWFGNWIPVGGRDFLLQSRLALGPTQLPAHWILEFFAKGKMAGAWCWPPTPI